MYYSDNGSTAVEIALKMAFRKFLSNHEMLPENVSSDDGNYRDLKVSPTTNNTSSVHKSMLTLYGHEFNKVG